jgi:hypothetical protein
MSLPKPIDVWEHVIDSLLGWRNDKYHRVSNDAIDHAISSVKELRLQSPAPSEIRSNNEGGVVLVWRSELQDMIATFDAEGSEVRFNIPD